MRPIKFRGKRIDNGEWVYGSLVNNLWTERKDGTTIYEIIVCEHDYDCWEDMEAVGNIIKVLPETVGQFTGLHDSKGVEIYEGDIVKYKTCKQNKDEYYEETKKVQFHSGSFGFQEWYYNEDNKLTENLYHFSNVTSTFYYKNYDIEVIGNIHEERSKK